MEALPQFQWGSKLGISVALFLACGGFFVFISCLGALVPFNRLPDPDRIFLMSDRVDVLYYGKPPRELMAQEPALRTLRDQSILALAGFMCAIGVLTIGLAWFGLKSGQPWALWTLAVAGTVVVPFWILLFVPYLRIGAPIWLGHPPFMSVPLLLLVPAVILGYLGTQ